VRIRLQPWQLAVLVVVLCAAAVAFVRWRKLAQPYDAARLFSALPVARGTLLYLDVETLRKGGILDLLAGSKAAEEPDYRNFVTQTGFDYRTDLDAVAAVFDSGQVYLTVRGHFDWPQLSGYARAQGGTCQYLICSMAASAPGRNISFYPLRGDVLALAVTSAERGVNMIADGQATPQVLPNDPAWLWAPRETFRNSSSLPAGIQLLLAPLTDAQSVALSAGPAANNGLRLRAQVSFASPNAAAALVQQFQSLTKSLGQMSPQAGGSPGSTDVAGLLAKGTVEQKDSLVTAEWPLDPAFLKSLAQGK
jgi:hypothetical protein